MSRQTIILILTAAMTVLIVLFLRACLDRRSQETSSQIVSSVRPLISSQVDSASRSLAEEWLQHDCVIEQEHPIELTLQSFAQRQQLETVFLDIYRHGPDSGTVVVPYLDEMGYLFDQRRTVLTRDTGLIPYVDTTALFAQTRDQYLAETGGNLIEGYKERALLGLAIIRSDSVKLTIDSLVADSTHPFHEIAQIGKKWMTGTPPTIGP